MSRPLRVLYAVTQGEIGGVERFLDSAIRHHDPDRVRPTVLSFGDGPWLRSLAETGVEVHRLLDARLRRPVHCFRRVGRILERARIDLVHSSYAWPHAMVSPAALARGCRRVWFHHGPMDDRRWQGIPPLLPADLLLTNSQFLREQVGRSWHGAQQLGVVHYGIDSELFAPDPAKRRATRRAWGVDEGTVAVGLVGFIDSWKGQDVFAEAATLLRSQGLPLRVFIVGGPREGRVRERCLSFEEQLRSYVREHGLEDLVTFTGHLDVREGALDALDVFVHASTQPEPFGMVILEAMAKGKAVIASAEGGPREIITHGEDGLLVQPRSPELLAEAVARLAADAATRSRLAAGARRTVSERFHPAVAARALEDWYDRIC